MIELFPYVGQTVTVSEEMCDFNGHMNVNHIKKVFEQGWEFSCNDFGLDAVSYTHLRAHETLRYLVCRLLLEKTKRSSLDLPIMVFYKNTLQMVVIFSLLKIHGFSGSPIALEEL